MTPQAPKAYDLPALFNTNPTTGRRVYWKQIVIDNGSYVELITQRGTVGAKNAQSTIERHVDLRITMDLMIANHAEMIANGWRVEVLTTGVPQRSTFTSIEPMLALDFKNHGHKIKFPCAAQPKYRGYRCLALVQKGKVDLRTRKFNPIVSVPHIQEAIVKLFGSNTSIILDGELYNHKYADNQGYINHIVSQKNQLDDNYLAMEYHVFDTMASGDLMSRFVRQLSSIESILPSEIKLAPTIIVNSTEELHAFYAQCVTKGYEGIIVRNLSIPYEHKRTGNMQKIKKFDSEEFLIIGIKEGRGALKGRVGSFICQTQEGRIFYVKLSGTGVTNDLRLYFLNKALWFGKYMTVEYQGYSMNGLPQCPIGIVIRDDM